MIKYANPQLNFHLWLDCVAQSPISGNANLTLIGGLNLIHLQRKIKSLISRLILKYWIKWPTCCLAFLAWDKDEHEYIDSILIYSNQKLRSRYRFGRASFEYNTNLIKGGLQGKTNRYYILKPIDQVLIALQIYASGGLLQVVSDTTGVDKSTVLLAVHNVDTILETITVLTHGKMHYGILIVD